MKVSIIIPVYNVSDYVERCIISVINQTYTDLECIIVDDCTPDDSIEKCERIIAEYKGPIRFKILHHEHNRGLSAARNTGTFAATGNYIFYLDSDDWIGTDCLHKLTDVVKLDATIEMVMGGIIRVGDETQWNSFLSKGIYTSNIIEYACQYKIYTMAWNKLINREFIFHNNLFFKEGLLHEDILWNIQVACFLKKMASIEDKTYFYRIRNNSIQTNNSKIFHLSYLAEVKINLIRFVFYNGFSNNKILYNYITKDLPDYICCERKIASTFYKKYRKGPYWTIAEQKELKTTKKNLLLSLNRYFPKALGFFYFRMMYKIIY